MRVIITVRQGLVVDVRTDDPDELMGQVSVIDQDHEPSDDIEAQIDRELQEESLSLDSVWNTTE